MHNVHYGTLYIIFYDTHYMCQNIVILATHIKKYPVGQTIALALAYLGYFVGSRN